MANGAKKPRRILVWLVASLAVVSGLFGAVWVSLQFDGPRRWAMDTALSAVNDENLQISYDELAGHWPWTVDVDGLEIADADGIWLTADRMSITWSPFGLVRNRLNSTRITLSDTVLLRLPEGADDETPDPHILPEIPDLGIEIVVQSFEIKGLTLEEKIIGHPAQANAEGDLRWTGARLSGNLRIEQQAADGLTAQIAMDLNRKANVLDLTIQGEEGPVGILHQLLDLPKTEDLAFALDGTGPAGEWQGRLTIDGSGWGRAETSLLVTAVAPLDIAVSSTFKAGDRLPTAWRDAAGDGAEFEVDISSATTQTVTIEALSAATESGIVVNGSGTLDMDQQTIQATANAEIEALAALSRLAGQPLSGAVTASMEISGHPSQPSVTAQVISQDTIINTTNLGQITGTVGWPGRTDEEGAIDLTIDSPLGPGTVQAKLDRGGGGTTEITGLRAEWLTTSLSGNATIDPDTDIWGDLSFNIASLAQLSFITEFAGLSNIAGSAEGRLTWPARTSSENGQLNLTLTDFQTRYDGDVIVIEKLEVAGRVARADDGLVDVSAQATSLSLPGLVSSTKVGAFTLAANGTRTSAQWTIEAQELNGPEDAVKASGELRETDEGVTLIVQRADGTLVGQTLDLKEPFDISNVDQGWAMSPLTANYGGGTLAVSGKAQPSGLKAELSMDKLPLEIEGPGFQQIAGTLSGDLSIDTLAAEPSGRGDITLLTRTNGQDLSPASVTARWQGKELQIAGDLRDIGTFEGTMPLVSQGGQFSIPGEGRIGFKADLAGDVGRLWRLSPYSEYELQGQGSLNVEATGSWNDPRISGDATLDNGYFESYAEGIFLKDLSVRIRAQDSERATVSLTASDGKKGRVVGNGDIRFQAEQNLPLSVSLDFDNAKIVRSDYADAQLSGRIALSGNVEDLELSGDLLINRMDVRIPNELPPTVLDLPVELVNVPPALQAADGTARNESTRPIALALNVRADNRIFVSGRGLDSEWKVAAKIRGDTDTPRVEGRADIIKGTFDFSGRSFTLDQGTVVFDGGKELDPRLDVLATRTDDDITVGIRAKGSVSDPTISFESSPSLPQEDVLARVLFGKPVDELTYVELAQLAESLATLSGKGLGGGGRGLFGTVRQSLGIDVFSVDTGTVTGATTDEEAIGPSLTVGKYVTDRVYVGVTQGTDEDSTAVEVDVDITRRLSLSTEVGQKANSNIGLNWSWDY